MALGDSTIVRMCIYRTLWHSKMAARALVISMLDGQGEKDYGEKENGKGERRGKSERGKWGERLNTVHSYQSNPFTSFRNIHVPITSYKNVWVGQLSARHLIRVKWVLILHKKNLMNII